MKMKFEGLRQGAMTRLTECGESVPGATRRAGIPCVERRHRASSVITGLRSGAAQIGRVGETARGPGGAKIKVRLVKVANFSQEPSFNRASCSKKQGDWQEDM